MHAPAEQARKDKRYFVVEGNIGAGKSTFLKIINHYLNAPIIYEPLYRWQNVNGENILEHFYQDPQRWAYSFQTFAFVTRIQEQEKYFKQDAPFYIVERSVYSDRYCFAKNCYEMGLMSSLEWKLYQEWFNWTVEHYTTKPSGFIYLQTKPEISYQRLLKRKRPEEASVALSYFELLHEKHESWLLNSENLPVLVLSCDEDFENNIEVQKKHMLQIVQFLEKTYAIPMHVSMQPSIQL
jgi:deoxyadenosine/deoxycytidine kinase